MKTPYKYALKSPDGYIGHLRNDRNSTDLAAALGPCGAYRGGKIVRVIVLESSKLKQLSEEVSAEICSDFGMLADSAADAYRGTDLDRGAVREIASAIRKAIVKGAA